MKKIGILIAIVLFLACSKKKEEPIVVTPDELHNTIDHIVDIMIHDIFSPR